ncbi:MAG: DedA family protein [archaeon]|nr:DedA family protein [archaeon]
MGLFDSLLLWTVSVFGPYGNLGLFALAFAESSFFPIPPDVLLIAFALADPQNAFMFAAIATIGSVAGGVFGYFLGKKLGEPLLLKFTSKEKVAHVQKLYDELGFWAVFAAGFSPIPYKVFTIFSGVMKMDLGKFILASVLSRGLRFFAVATVIFFYGAPIREFLNGYFEIITLAISLPIITFVGWKLFDHTKKKHKEKLL